MNSEWDMDRVYKTQISIKTQSNGHTFETKKAKAIVIVRDTSLWHDIHSYKVSRRYPKRLLSYGVYKIFWEKMFK